MITRFKLKTKLIGGFLIVAIIAGIIGFLGVRTIMSINANNEMVKNNFTIPVSYLDSLKEAYLLRRTNIMYVLSSQSVEQINKAMVKVEQSNSEMNKYAEKFEKTIKNNNLRKAYEEYKKAGRIYYKYFLQLLEKLKVDREAALNELNNAGIGRRNAIRIHKALLALIKLKKDMAAKAVQENKEYQEAMKTRMLIFSGVGFVIAILLGILLALSIIKPVNKVTKVAKEIAKGDMQQDELNVKTKDEIGVLAASFNDLVKSIKYKASLVDQISNGNLDIEVELASDKDSLGKSLKSMVESLNEILIEVTSAAEQVASGADQISAASQSLSQGASEQASSVEQISATSTEINNQAKMNSENISVAKELTSETVNTTGEANEKMDDLLNAMNEINNSSEEIKKITKVIDDIAFQINLLALNANVEAARAGKYGKGFAVVAEEVRNLAMKSADSVKETTTKIDSAINNITYVSDIVEKLNSTIKKVNESATKVSELMLEVTNSTKEQANAIEQIDGGLNQIESVTESNTANAEESAATSEELAAQAKQLSALIERFKLRKRKALPIPHDLIDKLPEDFITAFKKSIINSDKVFKDDNGSGNGKNNVINVSNSNMVEEDNEYYSSKKNKIKPEEVIALDDDFESF